MSTMSRVCCALFTILPWPPGLPSPLHTTPLIIIIIATVFCAKWAICCRLYKAHSVHFHCYYCASSQLSVSVAASVAISFQFPSPHLFLLGCAIFLALPATLPRCILILMLGRKLHIYMQSGICNLWTLSRSASRDHAPFLWEYSCA